MGKELDMIHSMIHGLRMIPKYKSSAFEQEVSKIICEAYQKDCSSCSERLEVLKLQTKLKASQPQEKSSFLGGLFE